jgi:hypothetical protein
VNATKEKSRAMAEKYGASCWAEWDSLRANPFAQEGKTVLFHNAEFEKMLTATDGLFNGLLFVDIPKGMFTGRKPVVLAGKVMGATNVKSPFGGDVQVPKVKFLGAEFCGESACKDFGTLKCAK